MNTLPKEKLYSTAYAPLWETYVGIERAYQDDRGEWIFACYLTIEGKEYHNFLFRKHELTNFVL